MGADLYYDKLGRPITQTMWLALVKDPGYKVVHQTHVPGYFISTVWLGLDHSVTESTPIIFETMVFPAGGPMLEQEMARYATLPEAIAGHQQMVEKWWWKSLESPQEGPVLGPGDTIPP
jgi:hypothetical protein